jgi:predicted nucleic acid-binding protein
VIVVDASVICEFLLDAEGRSGLADVLASQDLAAPALLEYEIGHALRRLNLMGRLSDERAQATMSSFLLLRIELHVASSLMSKAWELRRNISFYDACYVALAEVLEVPLYTLDKRLASAPGHGAQIICM